METRATFGETSVYLFRRQLVVHGKTTGCQNSPNDRCNIPSIFLNEISQNFIVLLQFSCVYCTYYTCNVDKSESEAQEKCVNNLLRIVIQSPFSRLKAIIKLPASALPSDCHYAYLDWGHLLLLPTNKSALRNCFYK